MCFNEIAFISFRNDSHCRLFTAQQIDSTFRLQSHANSTKKTTMKSYFRRLFCFLLILRNFINTKANRQ